MTHKLVKSKTKALPKLGLGKFRFFLNLYYYFLLYTTCYTTIGLHSVKANTYTIYMYIA